MQSHVKGITRRFPLLIKPETVRVVEQVNSKLLPLYSFDLYRNSTLILSDECLDELSTRLSVSFCFPHFPLTFLARTGNVMAWPRRQASQRLPKRRWKQRRHPEGDPPRSDWSWIGWRQTRMPRIRPRVPSKEWHPKHAFEWRWSLNLLLNCPVCEKMLMRRINWSPDWMFCGDDKIKILEWKMYEKIQQVARRTQVRRATMKWELNS